MDQQSLEALKDRAYDLLSEDVISALEAGAVTVEQAQESARYVLESLERITSYNDLIAFLNTLSQKWPMYTSAYMKLYEQNQKTQDKEEITEIQKELQQLQ